MSNVAVVKCVRPSALNRREFYGKTESVAYSYGSIMQGKSAEDGSTAAKMIAATSGTERVLGMLDCVIASTDSDYATAGARKPVLVDEIASWEFPATGADSNDPQGYIDLSTAILADVTASTVDLIFVTKFISSTKVRGRITGWAGTDRPSTN
jgi:hypothetical protein